MTQKDSSVTGSSKWSLSQTLYSRKKDLKRKRKNLNVSPSVSLCLNSLYIFNHTYLYWVFTTLIQDISVPVVMDHNITVLDSTMGPVVLVSKFHHNLGMVP